jgi:hypothetical protein
MTNVLMGFDFGDEDAIDFKNWLESNWVPLDRLRGVYFENPG